MYVAKSKKNGMKNWWRKRNEISKHTTMYTEDAIACLQRFIVVLSFVRQRNETQQHTLTMTPKVAFRIHTLRNLTWSIFVEKVFFSVLFC